MRWIGILCATVASLGGGYLVTQATSQVSRTPIPLMREVPIEHPEVLQGFAQALQALSGSESPEPKNKVRVLFIGDSAVVGDGVTGELRRQWQLRFGDGGHGFILPGKPWEWYRHKAIRHDGSGWTYEGVLKPGDPKDAAYGLGFMRGMSRTGAEAMIATSDAGDIGTKASSLEVWYLAQPKAGTFDIKLDDQTPQTVDTRASTTEPRYWVKQVPEGPHTLKIEAKNGRTTRVFGMVMERDAPGVVVDAIGVNGAHVRNFLTADPKVLHSHLARRGHTLIVVQLGTNASTGIHIPTFHTQLAELISRLKTGAPQAACLLLSPPDRVLPDKDGKDVSAAYIADIAAEVKKVAEESHCAFWDAYAAMGGSGSFLRWRAQGLASSDGMHLTKEGYPILARGLVAAVDAAMGKIP